MLFSVVVKSHAQSVQIPFVYFLVNVDHVIDCKIMGPSDNKIGQFLLIFLLRVCSDQIPENRRESSLMMLKDKIFHKTIIQRLSDTAIGFQLQ